MIYDLLKNYCLWILLIKVYYFMKRQQKTALTWFDSLKINLKNETKTQIYMNDKTEK